MSLFDDQPYKEIEENLYPKGTRVVVATGNNYGYRALVNGTVVGYSNPIRDTTYNPTMYRVLQDGRKSPSKHGQEAVMKADV